MKSLFLVDRIFFLTGELRIPEDAVLDAVNLINKKSDVPIVTYPSISDVYREAEGSFYTTGVQPPMSAKGVIVARFGAAWATFQDVKHVRILGDAREYKIHESFALFPRHLDPQRLVYPTVEYGVMEWVIECACGKSGDPTAMKWDGQKCWLCQEKAEWEKTSGFKAAW